MIVYYLKKQIVRFLRDMKELKTILLDCNEGVTPNENKEGNEEFDF